MLALTHQPSPQLERGLRTHVARTPIDLGLADQQHRQYCQLLRQCGADVRTLNVNRRWPDSVFIEDVAVVLEELAIVASMGAASRRGEPDGVEPTLRQYRPTRRLPPPARLEGGDVLQVGRRLLVGLSGRTNQAGIEGLEALVRQYGYRVATVPVRGCLHLKTACSALDEETLLVNPDWLDVSALQGYELVRVPDQEPWAANLAWIGATACLADDHPRTAEQLRRRGLTVRTTNLSEFAKAEGGVSCLSLVFEEG